MSQKESVFHRARIRTSAIIGYIASLISIFNFASGQIGVPVSRTFAAIIDPWHQYIIGAIETVDGWMPWLIPDWNKDFYAVALILSTIVLAGLKRFRVYDDDEVDHPVVQVVGPLLAPVFLMLCFAIPFIGFAMACLMIVLFAGLVILGERIVQPEHDRPDAHSHYIERRKRMRTLRLYTLGIVVGAAFALLANASLA